MIMQKKKRKEKEKRQHNCYGIKYTLNPAYFINDACTTIYVRLAVKH